MPVVLHLCRLQRLRFALRRHLKQLLQRLLLLHGPLALSPPLGEAAGAFDAPQNPSLEALRKLRCRILPLRSGRDCALVCLAEAAPVFCGLGGRSDYARCTFHVCTFHVCSLSYRRCVQEESLLGVLNLREAGCLPALASAALLPAVARLEALVWPEWWPEPHCSPFVERIDEAWAMRVLKGPLRGYTQYVSQPMDVTTLGDRVRSGVYANHAARIDAASADDFSLTAEYRAMTDIFLAGACAGVNAQEAYSSTTK
jgi:hypothetical protein